MHGRPPLDPVGEMSTIAVSAAETSAMLYLRPQSVSPGVRSARDHTGHDWDELVGIAREPDWPGYFGAPRMASPAQGARIFEAVADAASHYALQILDGLDPRSIPRIGTLAQENPVNFAIDRDALQREREIVRRQEEWLAARRMPR
jgi:hypothetical protein